MNGWRAIYFVPKYLKMGLTTIPQYLEQRFDKTTRTLVAFFLMISFVITLLPIVLYTGAINLESIFITYGLWALAALSLAYSLWGGLKAVALTDAIQVTLLIFGVNLV